MLKRAKSWILGAPEGELVGGVEPKVIFCAGSSLDFALETTRDGSAWWALLGGKREAGARAVGNTCCTLLHTWSRGWAKDSLLDAATQRAPDPLL